MEDSEIDRFDAADYLNDTESRVAYVVEALKNGDSEDLKESIEAVMRSIVIESYKNPIVEH